MAKQTSNEGLPTMEEFTEDNLLSTMEETSTEEQEQEEKKEEEEPEKPKATKKPETEEEPEEEPEEKPEKKPKAGKKPAEAEPEEEEEEEESSDAETFFTDVEALTGIEVEVEYPDDIDPLSPEGVALREQTLVQKVMADQLSYLQQNFPRSFKMLEHEAAGGSVEDLLKTSAGVDYSKIELKDDSTEQAKKILMDYYQKDKGLSEKKAQLAVEDDEDSEGGLVDAARKVLKSKVDAQKQQEEKIMNEQKQKAQRQKQQDMAFTGIVKQFADGGKIGKFEIPKTERQEFLAYALSNIHRTPDGSGYMMAVPLGQDNLEDSLQQLYFGFKGGDLDGVIQRRAASENAKKLRLKAKKEEKKLKSEEDGQERKKTLPTMDDYMS